jgi:hypothetical protein
MRDPVPNDFAIADSASLFGVSDRTFRRHHLSFLEVNEDGRITRESIERRLGFRITPERFLAARQRREGARRWQRDYARQTRGTSHVAL